MECYLKTSQQEPANVETEFYQGIYSLAGNKTGVYWCEDSRNVRSNLVGVFFESGITFTAYLTIPVCPAQTTVDKNGLVLQWPSITVGMNVLVTKFLSYTIDHMERKVPKYENHKLRERKVKTPTRN